MAKPPSPPPQRVRPARGTTIEVLSARLLDAMRESPRASIMEAAVHLSLTDPQFRGANPESLRMMFRERTAPDTYKAALDLRFGKTAQLADRAARLNDSALCSSRRDAGRVIAHIDAALGRPAQNPDNIRKYIHKAGLEMAACEPFPPGLALLPGAPPADAGDIFGLLALRAMHRGLGGGEFADGVGAGDLAALVGKVVDGYIEEKGRQAPLSRA